jgi:RHS repeat-associated protein
MRQRPAAETFNGAAFPFWAIVVLVFLTSACFAQCGIPSDYQIGFPEHGDFSGSDFESVQINNGNLHIEVPLWELPGRGLPTGYKYVYDSKGWGFNEACSKHYGDCADTVSPHPHAHGLLGCCDANNTEWSLVSSVGISPIVADATANCNAGNVFVYSYFLITPEGTKHHFVPDPVGPSSSCPNSWTYVTTVYADDGSGWIMQVNPLGGGGAGKVIRKDGVLGASEDTNGNQITGTDTLGRPISATSYYDSNGVLRNIQVISQNVAVQSNLCSFSSDPVCHEYSGTFYMPQAITLANGMSYTFTYDQGSPTHPYYGQPLSVVLPTGGQITWGWSAANLSGPILVTRQLSGDPEPWLYSIGGRSGGKVTDPAGNDTVYTCGQYVTYNGVEQCYITEKQYYQGSSTSGAPFRTVQTDYQLTNKLPILPIRQTTTWNQQNLVSQTETDYDSWAISGWTGFSTSASNPVEKREYDYNTGSRGVLTRTTDYGYLHLLNPTYLGLNIADRVTSHKIYAGSSQTGSLVAQTLNTYDGVPIPAGGNTSGNPAPNHDYTNFPASYNFRGNLTQVSKGLKSSNGTWTWLNTNNTYNDLGEVLTSTDPLGHQTTYDYTDNWATISNPQCVTSAHSYGFPTTITDPLSHQTKHTYYSCTSLTGSTQDANDIAASRPGTTFTYDLMDRELAVNYADGGQTTFSYNDAIPYTKTSTQLISSSPTAINKVTRIVHDGLGRMQQTQLVDPDCSSGPVNVDYTYSYDPSPPAGIPAGRFTTVSNPYCTTSDTTYGITKTRYDALDRPVVVVPPDGTDTTNNVSTVYAGNVATVTDEAGAARKNQMDALGRMTYVWEDPANANYETDYSYNVLDDLTGVTQKGGSTSANYRTRNFSYDSLGRLTQAGNPESGTITYSYDNDSNLFQKTSPQPNQIGTLTTTLTYCYDADNRLNSKTYSPQTCPVASPTVSYLYDQTSYNGLSGILNGIGRRTGMSDQSGATAWSFDPMGRAAIEQRKINGVIKQMSYYYYFDGEPRHLYYPSGNRVDFEATAAGRIYGVVDETYNYVFGDANFAPNGAIAGMAQGASATFPGGVYSAFLYNKRFQPALEYSKVGAAPFQWLKQKCYDYHVGGGLSISAGGISCTFTGTTPGNNGNVYQTANKLDDSRTQNFLYDHLNRVLQANTNGPNWGQSFQIDPWGNLTNVSAVTGKTLYGGFNAAPANTKNQLASAFSYDAAGNTLSDPRGNALTFDAENRIATDAGVTYTYDGDGERVEKSSGTLYWGGGSGDDALAESDLSGNISAEYIFFNGQRVARVDRPSSKVHYFLDDHLGSSRMLVTQLTSSTVTVEEDLDYTPYGTVANGTPVDHYEFNGKERDSESNLDEFGARYYASPFGRFMTPDWAAKPTDVPYANFGNPQSLNLYSYVQNNPTTLGDPDGHCCEDEAKASAVFLGQELVGLGKGLINAAPSAYNVAAGLLNEQGAASGQPHIELPMAPTIPLNNPGEMVGAAVGSLGLVLLGGVEGVPAGETGAVGKTAGEAVPKEGIYEGPDATAPGRRYVGQSGDIPNRLNQHEASGKFPEGTKVSTTEVKGGKTAREVAEHNRVQQLGGVRSQPGSQTSNIRNPIGKNRQHLLKKKD